MIKKKFKIVSSSILTVCLLFCMAFPANASEEVSSKTVIASTYDLDSAIENAKLGICDESISAEIMGRINVAEDDNKTTYSVEYLGTVSDNTRSIDAGNMYAVTATQKVESNDNTKDNVYAWLTLIWIDHFGTNNEIVEVSGGWESNGRTLSNRVVMYGYSNASTSYFVSVKPTNALYKSGWIP